MKYILLFLVACTPAMPWSNAKPLPVSRLTNPDVIQKASAFMLPESTSTPPAVRMLYGKTSCLSGPNPVWIPVTSPLPREGVWFRMGWAIEAVATPPPPRHSVALLAAFRSRSGQADLTPHGLPGCMLLVEPDYILRPTQNPDDVFYYNPATGLGYIQFLPSFGMRGTKIYMQLLVSDANGVHRLSAGVELTIGS